jgi:hypothetical protein
VQTVDQFQEMIRTGYRRLTLTSYALLKAPYPAECADVTFRLLENRSGVLTHGIINRRNQTFLRGITILYAKAESTANATNALEDIAKARALCGLPAPAGIPGAGVFVTDNSDALKQAVAATSGKQHVNCWRHLIESVRSAKAAYAKGLSQRDRAAMVEMLTQIHFLPTIEQAKAALHLLRRCAYAWAVEYAATGAHLCLHAYCCLANVARRRPTLRCARLCLADHRRVGAVAQARLEAFGVSMALRPTGFRRRHRRSACGG